MKRYTEIFIVFRTGPYTLGNALIEHMNKEDLLC